MNFYKTYIEEPLYCKDTKKENHVINVCLKKKDDLKQCKYFIIINIWYTHDFFFFFKQAIRISFYNLQ